MAQTDSIGSRLLSWLNEAGRRLPPAMRRRIADFPGALGVFAWLSRGTVRFVKTPEGYNLALNPLLHSNLVASGGLNGYEPVLREAIRNCTRPGMVAWDIGANVGVFALQFHSIVQPGQGVVYAFEPEENNVACFERTLAANDLRGIMLCKQAVGNVEGTAQFDRRGGAFSGRLVGRTEGYAPTHNVAIVETTTVDACVQQGGFRPPDIVKIDVEGNEGLVLEGMQAVMEKFHPIIICEIHTHLGDSRDRVHELLARHGYDIAALDASHVVARIPATKVSSGYCGLLKAEP